MIRSIVFTAPTVCNVDRIKCPVSAAERAVETVSSSRISPNKITSGASRNADFNAFK